MPRLKPHSPANLSKLTGKPIRFFRDKEGFNYRLVMTLLTIGLLAYASNHDKYKNIKGADEVDRIINLGKK